MTEPTMLPEDPAGGARTGPETGTAAPVHPAGGGDTARAADGGGTDPVGTTTGTTVHAAQSTRAHVGTADTAGTAAATDTGDTGDTAAATEPTGAVEAARAAAESTRDTAGTGDGSGDRDEIAGGPEENRRQALYWRLLARLFDPEEQAALESASLAVVEDLGLPPALLDPQASLDSIVQRHPELAAAFDGLMVPEPAPDGVRDRATEVRRAALASKLLLNVFAPAPGTVTAGQLARWQSDAGWLERGLGCRPGELRGGRRGGPGGAAGSGAAADGTGGRGAAPDLSRLLPEIGPQLGAIEADLVKRMHLREVLADSGLASRLTPSMSLIEQLLRDKDNLSGVALANAKALIRRFVDEVAEVLRAQVEKATVGELDRSVPPKRVFRNLDLDRTIWKNLTNWSPEEERLYVDRLYYRRTVRRTTPQRLIVVVDQSGSMVDSMVNCTILASIFAGLPKVDVHLVAYDTRAVDLTPWVHDPFETLLRTNLGGGTDGTAAMALAQPKIAEPRNTVVVWISDFYEWRCEELYRSMADLHRSGVRFIPVGSVTSSGRGSVNPWFRDRLKDLGAPVLSGHIRKLVHELKAFLT
ncbi:VWA domain-containing protein [Streptomyces sp. CC77]|uniref:VWA domain-containing protein n=1 Tax=Streptomyces sp. CC77 TaxID=1906739 RepID=UPI000A7A19EB|nr:VWA domain-containing protein [Streptomyces sp. CC77]